MRPFRNTAYVPALVLALTWMVAVLVLAAEPAPEPETIRTETSEAFMLPTQVDQFPYPLAPLEIPYPTDALTSAPHYIICEAIVDENGSVHTVLALGCEGEKANLCDEVLAVLPNVQFAPAISEGTAVSAGVVFPIAFSSPGEPAQIGIPVVGQWDDQQCGYTGRIYGSGELEPEQRPRPIVRVKAEYPEEARLQQLSGWANIKAIVGPDGVPCFALCESASPAGSGFAEAAIEATYKFRFLPGKKDGTAQAVWVEIPFRWEL